MHISNHCLARIGEDGESNNGVVICDEGCIVVDTANYPDVTEKDLNDLTTITHAPVKFLINTHHHGDHTFGNMYFSDIIAHKDCYEKLKECTPRYNQLIKEEKEFEGIIITLPNILFTTKVSLHCNPEIVITHCGGHTKGSAVVYVPEEKILFSGDLLFVGYHPYLGDADIQQWITALTKLLDLDIRKIVPGHGKLCDKQEIETHINYLETFYNNLKALKKEYTKKEIMNQVDLLQLPELGIKEWVARNVEAHYDTV